MKFELISCYVYNCFFLKSAVANALGASPSSLIFLKEIGAKSANSSRTKFLEHLEGSDENGEKRTGHIEEFQVFHLD